MPGSAQSLFPTIETVLGLVRTIINDTFPGIGGAQGRIYTDNAPFVIPSLNRALRLLMRKLRNEGVTFPKKDNYIMYGVTPVEAVSPDVQVYIGYNGYFDGSQMNATPSLPSDMMQPYEVWEQDTACPNIPFQLMGQPQGGIDSMDQGPYMGVWEWRNYAVYMPGSTVTKNLRLRYNSTQVPLNVPATSFDTTAINIIDCEDAIAYEMAAIYAEGRGAEAVKSLREQRDDAIFEMALEYVRRSQGINYRRKPYGGDSRSGSGNVGGTAWQG
jgi:hypothetical protein